MVELHEGNIDITWLSAIIEDDVNQHALAAQTYNQTRNLSLAPAAGAEALFAPGCTADDSAEDASEEHLPMCPLRGDQSQALYRLRDCQTQQSKKRRCQWTADLHAVFESAVRSVGARATPTTVHAAMHVDLLDLDFELTVGMVKSHLQKYKLDCQCTAPGPLIPPIYKIQPSARPPAPTAPAISELGYHPAPVPAGLRRTNSISLEPAHTSAHPSSLPPPHSKAILITLLDAPRAMGLLVRTFTGYALSYEYEAETNTLVLTATPPEQMRIDAQAFGLTTLSLLREAQVSDNGVNELALEFTRRCVLPFTPASRSKDDWAAQLVSTGHGDKTVCLQIEKASGNDKQQAFVC
jgi:SHAQKYF class myb-like DNA-binding protein